MDVHSSFTRLVGTRLLALLAPAMLGACTTLPDAQIAPSRQIVSDYVAAYNARDLDGMSALAHPQIEWLSVEESKVTAMASGKVDLMAQMRDYLSSDQATTSTLRNFSVNGSYVAVKETAHWNAKDGEKRQQSAIAVYQLADGLIRRVWYYPAEK